MKPKMGPGYDVHSSPILNRPKYLNVFDELKYNVWAYKSVLVAMYQLEIFYVSEKTFFLQFLLLLWIKAFISLLVQPKIYKILSRTLGLGPEGSCVNQAELICRCFRFSHSPLQEAEILQFQKKMSFSSYVAMVYSSIIMGKKFIKTYLKYLYSMSQVKFCERILFAPSEVVVCSFGNFFQEMRNLY